MVSTTHDTHTLQHNTAPAQANKTDKINCVPIRDRDETEDPNLGSTPSLNPNPATPRPCSQVPHGRAPHQAHDAFLG